MKNTEPVEKNDSSINEIAVNRSISVIQTNDGIEKDEERSIRKLICVTAVIITIIMVILK